MTPEPALPEDLPALKALHLASWRRSYRGLVPDAALDIVAEAELTAKWVPALLTRQDVWLLREAEGGIAGFVAVLNEADGTRYVDNLHVRADRQGRGLSRALMSVVAQRAKGHPVALTVLEGNARARAIYRHWGGSESTPREDVFLAQRITERRVTWPSGEALGQALGALR